ncbi:MAG: hypothetical protein RXO27_05220 [Acidilobus sp.]
MAEPDRKFIYKTTAVKRYGLTPHQIDQAVEAGLLKNFKYVKNPHYGSGPRSLLLDEAELQGVLDKVRALPKYSEEELRRKRAYSERSRKAGRASFYCPLCQRKVRPLRTSYARDALLYGMISPEEAKIVAIVTHFRHVHTDYDEQRRQLLHVNSRSIEPLKDGKTIEAIELAKKCGLLPADFTKEEYDKIALKIKEMYDLY